MTTERTLQATWPIDTRNLLPGPHQRAAWNALADSRDLLADIATTARLLAASAFTGQDAARRLAETLNTALIELEVELGLQGVLQYRTPS